MKRFITSILTLALILPLTFAQKTDAAATFSDINKHWAKDAILKAAELGIVTGYADGTFQPDKKVTRVELAAMLSRASSLEVESASSTFSDVPQGNWAYDAVNEAIALGFVNPADYRDGFGPTVSTTRYEVASWLSGGLANVDADYRTALADTAGPHALVPIAEFYKGGITKEQYGPVSLMIGTGLMQGAPNGRFELDRNVTRAEVATILLRYKDVEQKKASDFKALSEIREVGLYGTNAKSFAGVEYDTENPVVHTVPLREKVHFRNNVSDMEVHRMILTDITPEGMNIGAYANMFVDTDMKLLESKYYNFELGQTYYTFSDISLTPYVDGFDAIVFINGSPLRPFVVNDTWVDAKKMEDYGVFTYKFIGALPSILKTGETTRFWGQGQVDKPGHASLFDTPLIEVKIME